MKPSKRLPKLPVSALLFALLFFAASRLVAQDTRTVTEPTFPATCTALAAQLSTTGAEPSSETAFDTSRIQAALTACPAGQAVELTASGSSNAFLIQPINIPSGVTLLVDAGVTVFASRNPADYQASGNVETCGTVGTAGNGCNPLIVINNNNASSGSGIMGFGIIDGRGGDTLLVNGVAQTYTWWNLATQAQNVSGGNQNNPILLYPKKASNFTLYKITLINSPMFHVKYQGTASGFTVWGIKIVTPYTARNSDGIDPDDAITNITIANSSISDGDDDIAVGADGSGYAVSNITISGDTTYSGHGISIGSYTSGGVSNMLVTNVNQAGNAADSNGSGLKIKSAEDRGGLVNNISYTDICMQNQHYPLQFNPIYNTNTGTSYPSYQNIGLHNVSVTSIAGTSQVQIEGLNANYPLGITFDNLNIANSFVLTPTPQFANITLGPGPVTPASLQSLTGTVTYTGSITNPSEAPYACPSTVYPYLAGELFLSATVPTAVTNQKTLTFSGPASFTLNAVLEQTEAAKPAPTSPISFFQNGTLLGAATLGGNGTLAQYSVANLAPGTYTYTAQYPADANFAQYPFGSVTVTVNPAATGTTMTAAPASTTYGSTVTLTATVTSASGTPTGSVLFQNATTAFGTGTLNASGVASVTTTAFPTGTDTVYASYLGGAGFAVSSSSAAPTTVTVAQAATTTTALAPGVVAFGTSATLTAMVASTTSGNPTGSVTFKDGTATLTSGAALTNDVASYATSTLALGTHSITAVYSGDANFLTSTSSAQTVTVVAPVALSLSPTSLSLAAGASGTVIASVTPLGSFNGIVALTCSSPVTYIPCPVITSVMLSGTGPASATLAITVSSTYARLTPPAPAQQPSSPLFALLLPGSALLLLPLARRTRPAALRLLPILLLGTLFAPTACGGSGSSSSSSTASLPPAGTQTITITATANSTPVTANLTVNVTN